MDHVFGFLGRAFRPFFLFSAGFGGLIIPIWMAMWLAKIPLPSWGTPLLWHGHEMIYGFVCAAITGFLLTASAVWSGRKALQGIPLALLVIVWLAGRVVMLLTDHIPFLLTAIIDLSFLPMVAIALIWTLGSAGQLKNYALIIVISVLFSCNLFIHLDAMGVLSNVGPAALRASIDVVIILLTIIGGRIIPSFTANALNLAQIPHNIRQPKYLDYCGIGCLVLLTVSRALQHDQSDIIVGLLSLSCAFLLSARFCFWQSWKTRKDPLLWSLHLGAIWIVIGLFLDAGYLLGLGSITRSMGIHALAIGAIGASILAVVTRVALGHTGRPLKLPAGAVWIYILINIAAFIRVFLPMFPADHYTILLWLAGISWSASLFLTAMLYFQILIKPRPDRLAG